MGKKRQKGRCLMTGNQNTKWKIEKQVQMEMHKNCSRLKFLKDEQKEKKDALENICITFW